MANRSSPRTCPCPTGWHLIMKTGLLEVAASLEVGLEGRQGHHERQRLVL